MMSTSELKKITPNKRLISKKEILEIATMLNNFGFESPLKYLLASTITNLSTLLNKVSKRIFNNKSSPQ